MHAGVGGQISKHSKQFRHKNDCKTRHVIQRSLIRWLVYRTCSCRLPPLWRRHVIQTSLIRWLVHRTCSCRLPPLWRRPCKWLHICCLMLTCMSVYSRKSADPFSKYRTHIPITDNHTEAEFYGSTCESWPSMTHALHNRQTAQKNLFCFIHNGLLHPDLWHWPSAASVLCQLPPDLRTTLLAFAV